MFVPNPSKKIQTKNRKNYQKIKKFLSGIIFSQNGRRQADKEKKKYFSLEFRSYLARGRKFRKKIATKFNKLKNPFPALFLAKTGRDRPRKREKKILVPISIHTQHGQENSEKNSNKIKKPLSGIIFSQNRMRLVEKE